MKHKPNDITLSEIRNFGNNFLSDYSIPRRVLGKTGEKLSVIGFGGIMKRASESKNLLMGIPPESYGQNR